MNFYQEEDNSVDGSIDNEINENSDSLRELARELHEADDNYNPNPFLDVSEMTIPGQYQARDRPVGRTPASILKKSPSIRLSSLPESIRETAMTLDKNQDGDLSIGEIAFAIRDLEKKKSSNRRLKKTLAWFAALLVTLVACIFAASVTAARLSKDFDVSPDTGLALARGATAPAVVKTHSALERTKAVSIAELSNDELGNLREIILNDGDLRLVVKGYSRDAFDEEKKVIILIEGGTITYDTEGIVRATGNAKLALETIYGPGALDDNNGEGGRRRLDSGILGDKLSVPPPPPPPPPTETPAPTADPTAAPTASPTADPTAAPTASPTARPTTEPTAAP